MKWQQRSTKKQINPELIEKYSLPPLVASLFAARNITSDEQLDYWLNATVEDLADPLLFNQMDLAVERIFQALDNGEKITVYGDYDADGITSTTILVETLMMLGAEVDYYIPDRFKDGYGPNLAKYQELAEAGTNLLITVDNGITGKNEIAALKRKGVDVIITDHHTLPLELPTDAVAIIHPKLENQQYPFADFSGVGVAYSLCRALMDNDPMEDLLDLVAIGTIADLVPLIGENHLLVKSGLEIIKQQNRLGLAELLKQAKMSVTNLTATDVSFGLAPRLNSVGRIADANLAVKLLLNDDFAPEELTSIAEELEQDNIMRKDISEKVFQSAMAQVNNQEQNTGQTLVVYNDNFHEGVLGIVANRLAKELNKPTIVLTSDENGTLKGSGRSIAGFDIFKSLQPLSENILTRFGGHTMACGLSLPVENLEKLRIAFEDSFQLPTEEPIEEYDLEVSPADISTIDIQNIQFVGPFGEANPDPIFKISHPKISGFRRIGKNNEFFRFDINQNNGGKIGAVNFSMNGFDERLLNSVDAIYCTASLNEWNNRVTPQLLIEDIQFQVNVSTNKSNANVFDFRQEKNFLNLADTYLFYNENLAEKFLQKVQIDSNRVAMIGEDSRQISKAALMETPQSAQQLREIFDQYRFEQVYLRFNYNNLLVDQVPKEDQFRNVLKYVYQHPELTFSDYKAAESYLKTNENTLKFIFNVFLDLNFVKIDESKIAPIKQTKQVPLTSSKYLQAMQQRILFKQQLDTMPSAQLIAYISSLMK